MTLVPAGFTQDVTVTATRIETPIASLPNTVTVIDNNAIRSRTAVSDDLASLLETSVPGFGPSLKKLTGRGESLRGRNPLYTVNGVPQHTPLRDGERDGHTIDMDFLERVEVIHGSSAMQGIGGTGGIVNLVTKSPKSDGSWTQDVKLSLASHDSFDSDGVSTKLSYLLGKRVGKFDFIGGVSYHKRGMFLDAHGDLVGLYATQGDIMDSTQRGLYAKAGVALAPQQRLEVTVSDFKLERDGDFMAVPGSRAAGRLTTSIKGDPRSTVGDPARNDATTVSVEYRNKNLFGGDAIIQAYTYDYWALFEGGALPTFALTTGGAGFLDQSAITAEKVGAKLTYSMPGSRLAGFATTAGLDVTRDESAQVLARTGTHVGAADRAERRRAVRADAARHRQQAVRERRPAPRSGRLRRRGLHDAALVEQHVRPRRQPVILRRAAERRRRLSRDAPDLGLQLVLRRLHHAGRRPRAARGEPSQSGCRFARGRGAGRHDEPRIRRRLSHPRRAPARRLLPLERRQRVAARRERGRHLPGAARADAHPGRRPGGGSADRAAVVRGRHVCVASTAATIRIATA